MTTALYGSRLSLLMTALFWLPYILDRIMVRGLITAISGTTAEKTDDQSEWAKRAIRAHTNAIENIAIMAPAVLIAHVLKISTPTIDTAVMVYFFARLVHYLVYTAGIPVVRDARVCCWLGRYNGGYSVHSRLDLAATSNETNLQNHQTKRRRAIDEPFNTISER